MSVLSVAMLAGPAALALAANNDRNDDARLDLASIPALFPLSSAEALDKARGKVPRAARRVEERLAEIRERRQEREAAQAAEAPASAPAQAPEPESSSGGASPELEAIAACESGGDPSAVGGGGQYRGKYQFTYETWQSVGGSGDPAAASEAEQDRRAAALLAQSGSSPWPVCGA